MYKAIRYVLDFLRGFFEGILFVCSLFGIFNFIAYACLFVSIFTFLPAFAAIKEKEYFQAFLYFLPFIIGFFLLQILDADKQETS